MTPLQRKVLDVIRGHIEQNRGVSPTFDEIGAAIGRSKSNAYRVVCQLEKRGYIRRVPGLKCGITPLPSEPLMIVQRLCEELEGMLIHGGCTPSTPCADCQSARALLKQLGRI